MAITSDNAKLLFYARNQGVSFAQTLMIGRLNLYASKASLKKYVNFFGSNAKSTSDVIFKDSYAEPLFELLGATQVDSLDNSDYEGATIIHDLNLPIPPSLKNTYTAVVDGGTLEHVFNFPVAIRNCMEILKPGGHYISFTPCNNTLGHGFYQFSPELFYRIFSKENGFKIKLVATYLEEGKEWYEVADPAQVKHRVMLVNATPTHLIVVAEKLEEKEIFKVMPQQSDYQYAWNLHLANQENKRLEADGKLLYLYKKLLPLQLRFLLRKTFNLLFRRHKHITGLGTANPQYFTKIDIGV